MALTHEMGTAWLQDCWTFNELADAGIQKWTRNYAYPGANALLLCLRPGRYPTTAATTTGPLG